MTITRADFDRWRADPCAFIEEVLRDPDTGRPFVLTGAERAFLGRAFQVGDDGRLLHPELLFSAPKKSGKTCLAAMVLLYVILVLAGRYGEAYVCANDEEQSVGRVFAACKRIVENSPILMADQPNITVKSITFPHSGAVITALANDYAGAAGANPHITVFDELWGYTSEISHRLWDEMVPPPTRNVACRLTVTYAGFEGESDLLESLYKRALQGDRVGDDLYAQPGMLAFWTHHFTAPWQTEEWRAQMRGQLRPNAYLRLIENRWVSSESSFIDPDWWQACIDPAARPLVADPELDVWVGVDASVKRDSTAIVCTTWDDEAKRVRLVWHRVFQPSKADPLDFEATIEETLLDLNKRFRLRAVPYDPYQMQAVAQRLIREGVPMEEFPQSVPRLTESSTNLYELLKGGNIVLYPDDAMALAAKRSIAIETTRGWRIAKEKSSHKIDSIVALAMSALGATQEGQELPADPSIRSLERPTAVPVVRPGLALRAP